MNIDEAKTAAYEAIDNLMERGIRVEIKPSRGRESQSTVEKYGEMEGQLPVSEWNHVIFYPVSEDEVTLIYDMANRLASKGIAFDTGGCSGQRDWELDWSFRLSSDTDEIVQARSMCEDIIQQTT